MSRLLIVFVLFCVVGCSRPVSPTATLVYKAQQLAESDDSNVDINAVVTGVKNRLEAAKTEYVDVTPLADAQIAVILQTGDPKIVDHTKRLLSQPAILEFRIVADKRASNDQTLADLARANAVDPGGSEVRDADKKLVGKWVKLDSRVLPPSNSNLLRKYMDGDEEILVLIDEFNVTGQYLRTAYPNETDGGGAVCFELNEKGAELLGRFTESNLPDSVSGVVRQLAIILDGDVLSAGAIRSKVTDRGQITGHFTRADLQYLANILNAGRIPIPARLRLISESTKETP